MICFIWCLTFTAVLTPSPSCVYCHYTFKYYFHFLLGMKLGNSEKALAQGWEEAYQ